MDSKLSDIAHACLKGAETGTMTFRQIVGALTEAGFESYAIDFRRSSATYYLPSGESLVLPAHEDATPIAPSLDETTVREAIGEAQRLAPGYTYRGFCRKVMAAGCAGYIVSFTGRRAVYFGRTAETHVEMFPQ